MVNADNKRVMTQPQKVEYILEKGCEFLGLTRADFISGTIGRKSDVWQKKRLLIPILNDNTLLTPTKIADVLGYRDVTAVIKARDLIMRDISGELYGSKKIKLVYDELLTYLNLNNHENQEANQREETVA